MNMTNPLPTRPERAVYILLNVDAFLRVDIWFLASFYRLC